MFDLFRVDFIHFRLLDLIDILLVTYIFYRVFLIIRDSVAVKILLGVLLIYLLWWLFARVLHMTLIGTLMGIFINVGIIGLIIVFQPEIRRFLVLIGTNSFFTKRFFKSGLFGFDSVQASPLNATPILDACQLLSKSNTGALIVISRATSLNYIIETGQKIAAEISTPLIESIFLRTAPMHDGALIIENNQIAAARCLLPVSANDNLPVHLGTRHRAAIGITENTDAIALVVSEETGSISLAIDGELHSNLKIEAIEAFLK
ncbi:MAG: TIGR00159 family protein [Bacteroidia bacterium]|nr:TIGR00159 family protein [Bacteroidia bacterium]